MNKPKIVQRLLIFFIGLPLVASLVIFFPQRNHLALNIFTILISSLGAIEFALMLRSKGFPVYIAEAAILGSLSCVAATLIVSFDTNQEITQSLFIIGASWVLVSEIFYHKSRALPHTEPQSGAAPETRDSPPVYSAERANASEGSPPVHSAERAEASEGSPHDYSLVLYRLTAAFSLMIYPGLLLSWVITMSTLEHSTIVIIAFILTVMANDSLAWVTGMLFGKNNRGILPVSPNKSIAGYLGGMSASIGVCVIMAYTVPGAFVPDQIAKLPSAVLLGFFSGITVILGDLAESAIKRSSGFKDSGNLFPGRGGVLDSTDSLALTAPLFYVLYRFFF